jgi:hypothetical protein
MLPLIPLLAIAALCGGGGLLAWYESLSRDQQAEVDARANQLARDLFDTGLDQLDGRQARHVHALVRRQFVN